MLALSIKGEQTTELERATGVRGLVTADRLFALLERDFDTKAIECSVAKALRPSAGVDISAHKAVLEIARGVDGRVRPITTNIDLLFEKCDETLVRSAPPHLPDPSRIDDLAGIVHLHGHVNGDYSGSAGDGFVLSSAEFGRAYLSEGWATTFFRSIMSEYCVLFLGYGADASVTIGQKWSVWFPSRRQWLLAIVVGQDGSSATLAFDARYEVSAYYDRQKADERTMLAESRLFRFIGP